MDSVHVDQVGLTAPGATTYHGAPLQFHYWGPQVRVIRVLEYVGDRGTILDGLNRRAVKGTHILPRVTIREIGLTEVPEPPEAPTPLTNV